MRKHIFVFAVIAIPASSAIAAGAEKPPENATLLEDARKHFRPLPAVPAAEGIPAARIELGRLLFFEPRVSADGNVSCAHCHRPDLYGTDGVAKSFGVFGRANPRNAPTVFNAALLFKQHWRGDRENLEDQAKLFELLRPEQAIGVRLTEGYQLDPEQSTSAVIVHHPQAKYFMV